MSRLAVEKAKALHESHPGFTVPVDVERLARGEGCELVDWPFLRPVKEVKQGRWIGVARGVGSKERRYLVAHALAHHLLHCGNQLSFHQVRQGAPRRQEREADECAAHILMPGPELDKVTNMSVWELADYFDVPEELVRRRLSEFATGDETERWERECHEHSPV